MPEHGTTGEDRFARFPVGPGLQAAMRQAGDQPLSREWYPRDAAGTEIGVALAFGEQGCWVWSPLAGVRLLPFAAGRPG